MTNATNALTGVLSRIAAAGLTTRQVEFETPDGAPMTLTIIDTSRRSTPGRERAERRGSEPDQGEQLVERTDNTESLTKWA